MRALKTALLFALWLTLAAPGLSFAAAPPATDDAGDEDAKADAVRLPVPRFASLRSDKVNMRTGPGTRYPIEWVYERKGLPVEIIADYDLWRRVRDPDGSVGWIHKSELSGRRMAIVTGAPHDLRDGRSLDSSAVAHLEPGALGQILGCNAAWCKINFDGHKGYLQKSEFWGAYDKEEFN